MDQSVRDIEGVLLAGGKSRRMGKDKRELLVGSETLLERALKVYESVFSQIKIVVAEHSPVTDTLSHQVLTDIFPNKGPVGGLFTALSRSASLSVFLAACDMPFLSASLIRRICELSHGFDVTMVQLSTGMQPMQGVYSRRCTPILKEMIEDDQLEMRQILSHPDLKTHVVEECQIQDLDQNFLSFMNVNTPSDLEMANKLLRSSR
ncbi:MAG: molybdenum cofactor guanylyltransferase [Nitrospirales bacterium]|nr:molybdenum cofactor guanylyltransferase [Nitrospira sp.]MDR4500113.1 molybdenum cofactor guanylyltransferase [Nitrospirales bacterium]